jgi:hypothetical protein
MPQMIPAAIGGIGSLVGGLLGGPSQKSTSTTSPNFLPGQQDLLSQLFQQYMKALGQAGTVQPADRAALMQQINASYAGMKPSLESDLTARGFSQSGKLGKGFEGVDIARGNAQQQGEVGLQQQAMQRWLQLIGMGPSMGQPFGGTTTTSTGTQQQGLGQTIGGAISPLGTALALNNPFAPSAVAGGGANPPFGGSGVPAPSGISTPSMPPPPPPGSSIDWGSGGASSGGYTGAGGPQGQP